MVPNLTTIVIADDHELLRTGICAFLSKRTEYKVIGEASNGLELVELCSSLSPHIAIVDVQMPKMDGIQATKRIVAAHPKVKVLAMSFLDSEYAIIDMLEAGAMGYLHKGAAANELFDALNSIMSGQYYYSVETQPELIKQIAARKFQSWKVRPNNELTDRELQIIKLLCQHVDATKVSEILDISKRTIETHLSHMYKKLGVNNLTGLIIYALQNGIWVISAHQNNPSSH